MDRFLSEKESQVMDILEIVETRRQSAKMFIAKGGADKNLDF
jgi:hypothetical protein